MQCFFAIWMDLTNNVMLYVRHVLCLQLFDIGDVLLVLSYAMKQTT